MGYKNAELRLGKNDTQLDDPRAGEVALRIDSTGAIFTKPEGAEEVAVGGGSVPAGVDGAGASNGQVWTADGADGAGWVAANPSLSDYENVVVVDAGGNGDYTTLGAAGSGEVSAKTFYVIGDTIEVSNITPVDGSVFVIPSGSSVNFTGVSFLFLNNNSNIVITGNGEISAETGQVIAQTNGSHTILGTKISGTGKAMELQGGEFYHYGARVLGADGALAILFTQAITGLSLGSYYKGNESPGFSDYCLSNTGAAWADAPFYHGAIYGNLNGIAMDAGTTRGTCVQIYP